MHFGLLCLEETLDNTHRLKLSKRNLDPHHGALPMITVDKTCTFGAEFDDFLRKEGHLEGALEGVIESLQNEIIRYQTGITKAISEASSQKDLVKRLKKILPPREKFTLHVYNRMTNETHAKKEILATRVEASTALGDIWNERAAGEPNRGWIAKVYDSENNQIECIDSDDDSDDEVVS